MNQILYTGSKKKSTGKVEINKIVKFFAVLAMIFGIVLIGQASFSLAKNYSVQKEIDNINKKPVIKVDQNEGYITFLIEHDKELAKVRYIWNNGEEVSIDLSGQTTVQKEIKIPSSGNNKFRIIVVDVLGIENSLEKDYNKDTTKPVINLTVIEGNPSVMRVTATDEKGLQYITYRWDNEQEVKVNVDPNTPMMIETEIEILKDEHTLTVIAVNVDNETVTKEQAVKGVELPKIEVSVEDKYLVIKVTDDKAIKIVNYELNGKSYKIDYTSVTRQELVYRQEMDVGENILVIEAINIYDRKSYFQGRADYNP